MIAAIQTIPTVPTERSTVGRAAWLRAASAFLALLMCFGLLACENRLGLKDDLGRFWEISVDTVPNEWKFDAYVQGGTADFIQVDIYDANGSHLAGFRGSSEVDVPMHDYPTRDRIKISAGQGGHAVEKTIFL